MKQELEDLGYYFYRDKVAESCLNNLRASLDKAFSEHKKIQEKNNSEVTAGGVALHAIGSAVRKRKVVHENMDESVNLPHESVDAKGPENASEKNGGDAS